MREAGRNATGLQACTTKSKALLVLLLLSPMWSEADPVPVGRPGYLTLCALERSTANRQKKTKSKGIGNINRNILSLEPVWDQECWLEPSEPWGLYSMMGR